MVAAVVEIEQQVLASNKSRGSVAASCHTIEDVNPALAKEIFDKIPQPPRSPNMT